MKNYIYLSIIFSILFASCKSNENEEAELLNEDLVLASQNIRYLQTDFISGSSDNLNAKYGHKSTTKLKKVAEDCFHESIHEETSNGITAKSTERYFDKDKNAITNCELNELFEFFPLYAGVESISELSAEDFQLIVSQYINISVFLESTGIATQKFNESYNTDLEVYMNLGGMVFNFLEGSYINNLRSFTFGQNTTEEEFEAYFDEDPELELKYIIELEVNDNNYHFNMIINNNDFGGNKIEKNYDFINDSGAKVAVVKYTLNASGEEEFFLYDLEGNIFQ